MNYSKIGNFILQERKAQGLTQAKLADKLFVSEKTVSKWETGKGLPDTSVLPALCEVLHITVNELLNGERISTEEYVDKAEKNLLLLQQTKEDGDKALLSMEWVIGILSIVFLLSLTVIAAYVPMETWLRIFLVCFAFAVAIVGIGFALKIEQIAGYYVCKKCGHKYVPKYHQVFWAMHLGRTRYMKCPCCNRRSWNKKSVK